MSTGEGRLRIALTADPELAVPPRLYGGIERIVDMLARTLVADGHDVTLFANATSTCPVRLVPWRGASSGSASATLRNAITLGRHVVASKPDIVHSFSRLAYMTPILPLPIPKLMSYQRDISARTTALARRVSRGSLAFSAASRDMIAGAMLAGDWTVVPNGVVLGTYAARGAVAADAPLMFLGRMEPIKGPDLAIAAARGAGLDLVLAGNIADEHRPWFEAEVAPHIDGDRVRYVGPVDDAGKNALLGQARALLMPIRWDEPFGIVMIEAMACGTPVIGFRRGAVPEVLETGVTGFVVDTLEEMIAAIARVHEIDRAACRARVERRYSERAVADGYLALYRKLIGRRARAERPRQIA
jgi:glycosyltransferase involved in cell wall biosynthesis